VHARTTIIQGDPRKIDDGLAHVRDQVMPEVTQMEGCVGMSLLVDRQSGRCIATTAWESEAAMQSSLEKVRPLRDRAQELLGATDSQVDMWEVAVVHRTHAAPEGACARITWVRGDPQNAERALDIYKMGVLPRLQELDGFCSASLMMNRAEGRAVGTAIFNSREHLEASRDAAARLRETAVAEMGMTLEDVAEMEVAFLHLHLPEMA
jgi:quinol monooxygenase YgiN